MLHKVRHLVEVDEDELTPRRRPSARPRDRAAQPEARTRLAQAAQARRSRRGLRHRQDLGSRPEGLRLARRLQGARPLRGRPDADSHADAQAARPAHEEVDAVRAVPHAHPGRQPAGSGGAVRGRRRGTLEALKAAGSRDRKGVPVKVLAKGEITKALTVHAHAFQRQPRVRRSRPPAAPCRDREHRLRS